MSGAGLLQEPRVVRIGKLLQEIYRQSVRVPRFQRPFVWTDAQRLELLESIYSGMPIGSILVWRTAQVLPSYEQIGRFRFGEPKAHGGVVEYVLDGHQRLATLYGALMPGALSGLSVDGGALEVAGEEGARTICFDLKERAFRLGSRSAPHLLPLDIALDSFKLFAFQRELLGCEEAEAAPEDYKKLSNRAEHFSSRMRDYPLPVLTLATETLSVAVQAFVRANSQGQRLDEASRIHALLWPEVAFDERLEALRARLGGGLEDGALIARLKEAAGIPAGEGGAAALVERLRGEADVLFEAVR